MNSETIVTFNNKHLTGLNVVFNWNNQNQDILSIFGSFEWKNFVLGELLSKGKWQQLSLHQINLWEMAWYTFVRIGLFMIFFLCQENK